MLIKNLSGILFNGATGAVTGINSDSVKVKFDNRDLEVEVKFEAFSFEDEKKMYKRIQIPLILSYALTIHKSQGNEFDFLEVDLDRVIEKGQAYVALSRAKTEEGLWIKNFDASKIIRNELVDNFYANLN